MGQTLIELLKNRNHRKAGWVYQSIEILQLKEQGIIDAQGIENIGLRVPRINQYGNLRDKWTVRLQS
jgi:hypothetical protein